MISIDVPNSHWLAWFIEGVRLPLYFYQKYIIDINDIIFPIKIIKKRGMQPFWDPDQEFEP